MRNGGRGNGALRALARRIDGRFRSIDDRFRRVETEMRRMGEEMRRVRTDVKRLVGFVVTIDEEFRTHLHDRTRHLR